MCPFARGQASAPSAGSRLRFEVAIPGSARVDAKIGRLLVALNPRSAPEPRFLIGHTAMNAPPVLGRDVIAPKAGETYTLDASSAIYPVPSIADIAAGEYRVQAVLMINRDLWLTGAPGNLYSDSIKADIDPAKGGAVKLSLSNTAPDEELPDDTDMVRYVKFKSDMLSTFHGRDMFMRAGVVLPRHFEKDKTTLYPLRVQIGGFGTRYTAVQFMMSPMSGFRRAWMADDAPRMVLLHLDGAGPFGDPYQVNSANNGPYGDALTQELIPFIEKKFRCIGKPHARVLTGGSTGGWVSLGLQVFYPDFFGGCWSGFPDGVDFRAFELVNIYKDKNAYVNRHGAERPSKRQVNGEVVYTVRNETQRENVIGLGDCFTTSGLDWGSWNAVYGERGADDRPVPIWDPKTGKINHETARAWKKYDLRLILETNWKTLAPKLRGKIHVWVGDGDDYYLNNAVRLLDGFLSTADPPYEGWIKFAPEEGHGWNPFSQAELMKEMQNAVDAGMNRE